MKRAIKWAAVIGCMVGYGELRAISVTVGAIGIGLMICALIYSANDMPQVRKKRREKSYDNE